jgi:MarR family transcriptional regulator, organic hydroperoxide resistance regulator
VHDVPVTEIDAPPLSDQLCFDLYAASRAVTAAYRPALAELGLTYPQYLVLIVLWEQDERAVRDIAEALRLDHGTLTPLLRRMEGAGFVARHRHHWDERFVVVSLTAKGERLRSHAERIHCEMKAVLALSVQEFSDLQMTLRTLTERVSS